MRAFTLDRFDVPPGLREDFPAPVLRPKTEPGRNPPRPLRTYWCSTLAVRWLAPATHAW